jgi:DNA-directed RNA polymerase beta' subunit
LDTRLRWVNWNVRYAYDKAFGKEVMITNEVGIDRRTVKPIENGLYTKELGSTIDTDKDLREYSCLCGELNSRLNEGDICDTCGTICEEQFGVDLDRYGWIDLEPYFIIQPAAYEMIKKVVGSKTFDRMINYQMNISIEGSIVDQNTINIKQTPFQNIGIIQFKKRFVEIMSYFAKIKPLKADRAILLIKYKNRVFADKIPIFSSLLRPAYASGKKKMFSYDKINSHYTSILNNIKLLKNGNSKRLKVGGPLIVLYSIQTALQNAYHATITTKLSGKHKLIRNNLLSTRVSFSARAIITSLVGKYSGMDHVVMGYRIFIELFTLEILNCMMRNISVDGYFKDMTLYECLQYLKAAKYSDIVDERIYYIIEYLITNHKQGLWVLINRNPTMDLGSTQTFKIVHVIKDTESNVLELPLTTLAPQTADFDGDTLNVWGLKTLRAAKAFIKAFSPRYLILDPTGDDKLFSKDFSLIKDQLTSLTSFIQRL